MAFESRKISLFVLADGTLLARPFVPGDPDLPDVPRVPVAIRAAASAKTCFADITRAAFPARASLTSLLRAQHDALWSELSTSRLEEIAGVPRVVDTRPRLSVSAREATAELASATHWIERAAEFASTAYLIERARYDGVRDRMSREFDSRKVDRLIDAAEDAEHAEEMEEEEFARLDALAGRERAEAVADEVGALAARGVPPHSWIGIIAEKLHMPIRTVARYVARVKAAKKNGQMAT